MIGDDTQTRHANRGSRASLPITSIGSSSGSSAPTRVARAAGGSGIGLTIARAIVQSMGGRISAASTGLGHGVRFVVTLPRALETDRAVARAEPFDTG